MSGPLLEALSAVVERLVSLAAEDAQLRQQLRQLAQAVLERMDHSPPTEAVAPPAPESATEAAASARDGQPTETSTSSPAEPQEPRTPLPELTLGRATAPAEPPAIAIPARWTAPDDSELGPIEQRCRLKAEGARWAATRRRLMQDGADFYRDIEPMDRDIIARAKALPDCFLWMCHPSGPSPSDPAAYEEVAGCFEAVAEALAVWRQAQENPELHGQDAAQALDLLAEAQSALRVAVDNIDGQPDSDQYKVFQWLRATANSNQIFIQRYMRADDLADPAGWSDLCARIEALDGRLQETRRQAKQRHKLLGKVRHKASLISAGSGDPAEHWRILAEAVDQLVREGLPPSSRQLRDLLVPVLEDLADLPELPRNFQLVLREIDRFLATQPPSETTRIARPTPEVQAAARLLKDRSVVLIGGHRRPESQQALREALGLRELIWVETREHEPIDTFEPYVARPEVALVLLAIRWSSHSHGEVQEFCQRHGKPLVRLPGGYSPNQVAAQIMQQCSQRLQDG